MATPILLSSWTRAAFTFAGTAVAAMPGGAVVAAIGLAVPFELLMIALWVDLPTGPTSPLSRATGEALGVCRDDPVSKGCASPFAPIRINELVRPQGGSVSLLARFALRSRP